MHNANFKFLICIIVKFRELIFMADLYRRLGHSRKFPLVYIELAITNDLYTRSRYCHASYRSGDRAELRYSVHLDGWGTPREIPRGVYIIIDGYHQL